jgi:hypothetical protein
LTLLDGRCAQVRQANAPSRNRQSTWVGRGRSPCAQAPHRVGNGVASGRFAPQVLTYGVRGLAWDAIDPSLQAFERMSPV